MAIRTKPADEPSEGDSAGPSECFEFWIDTIPHFGRPQCWASLISINSYGLIGETSGGESPTLNPSEGEVWDIALDTENESSITVMTRINAELFAKNQNIKKPREAML